MSIYNKLIRNEKLMLQDVPTYMSNSSTLQKLKVDTTKLHYKDISLPHINQVFIINDDDPKGTVHTCVLHIVEQRATLEVGSSIIVTGYLSFINDPEADKRDPVVMYMSLTEDEEGECAANILGCNFTQRDFPQRPIDDVKHMFLQYIYNNVLLIDNALSNKNVILGTEIRQMKTREAKGKKAYSNVIFKHISLRTNNYNTSNTPSKSISWDYSWIVRGHWRYFTEKTKMGLSRSGLVRDEVGRTWINEYVKNEGEELDTRIRLIGATPPAFKDIQL